MTIPVVAKPLTPEQFLIQAIRQRAKADLYLFAKFVLGYKDLVPHIHGKLCRWLQDRSKKRRLVILPRGFFKSTIISIAFPMWLMINNPNIRVLLTQNTLQNAAKRLGSIDGHFKSNAMFRGLFHDLLPDKNCRWNNSIMTVRRPGVFDEGTIEAAGTRTKRVSNHYDVVIEDDTVTPDLDDMEAQNVTPSPEDIEQAIGWHSQLTPLFQNPADGESIFVGTRWAQRDGIAWIKENQPEYEIFEMAVTDDAGQPTFPERFNLETLAQIKAAMGPYLYACNYQNSPMRSEDMVFRPEWFKYFLDAPPGLLVYTFVDPSGDPRLNRTGKSDYNTIITNGKDPVSGIVYVLETWRKKCSPGELIDELFATVNRWKPIKVCPGLFAYENTLVYWVKERMKATGVHFVIDPVRQGNMSKNSKIMGLQPLVANGSILFRKSQRELVSELEAFPLGANDDLADTLGMGLSVWRVTAGGKTPRPKGDDRYLFDDAEAELMARGTARGGLVMDIMQGAGRPYSAMN